MVTLAGSMPKRPRSAWPMCGLAAVVLYALLGLAVPRAAGQTTGRDVPDLDAIQKSFERVVDRVTPCVVGIRAHRRYYAAFDMGESLSDDSFEQRVIVNGSGTIVRSDGLILTNEHVIQAAAEIEVLFHDGSREAATLWASDPRSDLAILKVERGKLPVASFCDWSKVARGQWTIAIGNPYGLGRDGQLSVSTGIVSNLGRQLPGLGEVDDRFYHDMIQTTAPINPGNSGGPLFNIHGELIGVITAMHTRAPADEGIGFAIPMTPNKRRVIETLCAGKSMHYGYIGLTVRVPTDEEWERHRPDAGNPGVVVDRVEPDGPADQAGLKVGDYIHRYGPEPIDGPARMAEQVGLSPIGSQVDVTFVRDGHLRHATIHVEEREVSRVSWMRGGAVLWRGLRLADLTDDARRLLRLGLAARGVVVIDVDPDSPGERAGLEVGQVIEAIDGTPITDTTDFLGGIRGQKEPIVLSVRDHGVRTISP